MSARHYSSLSTKLRALSMVEQGQRSIREISNDLKIPKSTLHDNLPIYRLDIARFMDSQQKCDYQLVRNILIQSFDGKTSSRSCAITLSNYNRAHDSKERQRFWGEKIAKLRTSFRQSSWVNQEEVDRTITIVSQLMGGIKKSNSLMEAVNSVIRCHLQTYKSIPRWFCSLFIFYWNHRRFERGKRQGMSPIEIISGQKSECDWVDMILEKFPFERLHYKSKPIPQTSEEERKSAA